jgi:hypothetical protein
MPCFRFARQTIAVAMVGLTTDQMFVSSLSRGGLLLPKDGKEALVAKVTLEAFGTLLHIFNRLELG